MLQWKQCKDQAGSALLLFRLGDFYEAFYEDAQVIAKELGLTLTHRQGIPMCGVPWHTTEGYVDSLVEAGFRVAIAEQVEGDKNGPGKGLMSRMISRIVSPGTGGLTAPTSTEGRGTHTFFAAITREKEHYGLVYGLALLDIQTAQFLLFESSNKAAFINTILRYAPKELFIPHHFITLEPELMHELDYALRPRIEEDRSFRFDRERTGGLTTLHSHFQVHTLDGFGLKEMHAAICSAGALLSYVQGELHINTSHIRKCSPIHAENHMLLDRATLSHLEIVEPLSQSKKGARTPKRTLLDIIDATNTPMGARLLRQWLLSPLLHVQEINARQDAIAECLKLALSVDDSLARIDDIERIAYRIQAGLAGPRDYVALKASLRECANIKKYLDNCTSPLLTTLRAKFEVSVPHVEEVHTLIERALVDNPPLRVSDGSLFKRGYNAELDELYNLRSNGHEWLHNFQNKLREELGIKTIKVGFTKMFGYYIEVSRGASQKMPDTFVRRQTLVNAERYICPELKDYEEKILQSDARTAELEQQCFQAIQAYVTEKIAPLLEAAHIIATLDVIRSLAITAEKHHFKRPIVDSSKGIEIVGGRHPVIEAHLTTPFTPNDIHLGCDEKTLMLLTGPNMAGKSTYIRQVALLVILAQIGSFIPAAKAKIGIVDKVFSRIGASDDIARGQSTFMVEMAETASILNLASNRSLVILDEIGRGTSTYDGISIAWAVAEFLIMKGVKTLFATHYYELTELENHFPCVCNYHVAVSEHQDGITFLHTIVKGKTDRSYGIHVARIAGLPPSVVARATVILAELEKQKRASRAKPVLEKGTLPALPDLFH